MFRWKSIYAVPAGIFHQEVETGTLRQPPLRIKVQVAAGLPSLQMDLTVMCIMSDALDVIQILLQLESEGLDPRLNQVKSDIPDFRRDIQMDLNVSLRWTWVMRLSDFYQMDLIEGHTPRRTWVCEPTLVKTNSVPQWCQKTFPGVTIHKE